MAAILRRESRVSCIPPRTGAVRAATPTMSHSRAEKRQRWAFLTLPRPLFAVTLSRRNPLALPSPQPTGRSQGLLAGQDQCRNRLGRFIEIKAGVSRYMKVGGSVVGTIEHAGILLPVLKRYRYYYHRAPRQTSQLSVFSLFIPL